MISTRALLALLVAAALLGCTRLPPDVRTASTPTPLPTPIPTQTPVRSVDTAAPSGARIQPAQWIAVPVSGGKRITAAVFRPEGSGPFPLVVVLHGTSGFSNPFLQLASDLSKGGFVAVAGCWFGGHFDAATRADQPAPAVVPKAIACADAPDLQPPSSPSTIANLGALVTAARALPGVDATRTGVLGHSRGSAAALTVAMGLGDLRAVVASAGVPSGPAVAAFTSRLTTPVLLLQGEADVTVPAADTRAFEAALRAAGRGVQSHYYPAAPHGYLFEPRWHDDFVRRSIEFFAARFAR